MIAIIALSCGVVVSAVVGYLLGHRHGGTDKMIELETLQEEGWLVITYAGDKKKPESLLPEKMMTNLDDADMKGVNASREDRLKNLMLKEEARPRRDSPERRGDWATAIKKGLEPDTGEDEEEEDVLDFKDPEV